MLFAFDMMATRFPRSWEAQIHEGRAAQIGERAQREAGMPATGGRARKGPLGTGSASFRGVVVVRLVGAGERGDVTGARSDRMALSGVDKAENCGRGDPETDYQMSVVSSSPGWF